MPIVKWTYEKCYELAQTCKTRSELKFASNAAYNKARKEGWLDEYVWLKDSNRKPPGYWDNYENCKNEAQKYSSRTEFYKNCPGAAFYSRKNLWINDFYGTKAKPRNYWDNYEHCYEAAIECKSRSEFSDKNSAAYMQSLKNGWINSFDWLIDKKIFNNNKVDCVYAYEFDKFKAVYVGRTLMRRVDARDLEHRKGVYCKDQMQHPVSYDGVLDFSIKNSCDIPEMRILEDGLTLAEGRNNEHKWIEKYSNEGWYIINVAKTGKFTGSIGSLGKGKWSYDTCKAEALKYKSLSEFKRSKGGAYEASRINNWLKDYTWFIDTKQLLSESLKRDSKWTYEKCYELALTCKTISEFHSKSSRALIVAKQQDWLKDYVWFVSGFSLIKPSKWTQDKCRDIASTCKTKTEFKRKNGSAYQSARVHNWLKDYYWFDDGNVVAGNNKRKYTYDVCFEIAKRCTTRADFKRDSKCAYDVSRKFGWIKDYVWFSSGRTKGRKWTYEALKSEAVKFTHKEEFTRTYSVAYRKARAKNYLEDFFKTMKFNFDGYPDICGFNLDLSVNIELNNYKYIKFSSAISQKKVYDFYKEEMQQGNTINTPNLGWSYIKQTGFFDLYPKRSSWSKFQKEVCPIVLYKFEVKDDIVWLRPLNVMDNNTIYKSNANEILEL
ncbi:MAG: hypothetical protein IKU88_09380 [Alistipes sp.]|nr:hypothetical protein [Alistipes sp.]